MNSTFHDQLGGVAELFEQWGPCERTVMACALARRVPWPGLKLVQRAVEAALQLHVEDEHLERDANDETLLTNLLAVRSDEDDEEGCDRLRQLLRLLPLLHTHNSFGAGMYVRAAPALVQRCVARAATAPLVLLCRQLLSYLLVHPALTPEHQKTLTQWLLFLENHISGNINTETVWQQRLVEPSILPETNIWSSSNTFRRTIGKNVEFRGIVDTAEGASYNADLLQESFSKNGRDVDLNLENEKLNFDLPISFPKSQRSNSLTPPSTNMHISSSAENLSDEPFVQKPRSFSLSSEHSLRQIRPIGTLYGTTGSETRLDDLRSNNCTEYPGMSTVAQWLKSLRLHKYIWLFTNISYEQMMAMDEEYLEKLGVTKGARHKILLSIKKLSERHSVLEGIQAELTTGGAARALERLRAVLLSPMPPGSDLPAAVVRTLDLASKVVSSNMCGATDEDDALDPMALHCWLVEKALHHASFSERSLVESLRRLRHRLPPRQFFHLVHDTPLRRGPGGAAGGARWRPHPGRPRRAAPPPAAPRHKSHSYPPYTPRASVMPPPPPPAAAVPPALDYSSLDALCLQMTEQAIN